MKIALIGPGIMPIPTTNWGAVESIIWQMKISLEGLGHEVVIFNTKDLASVADTINNNHFDFIHLHYDEYIPFFNQHLKKPYCVTSHFGYILQPQYWFGYYDGIFRATLQSPGIISLWEKIENVYKYHNYKGWIKTLRNGAEVNRFRFDPSVKLPKNYICVGKVESRKCQAKLQAVLDGRMRIDFVGPIGDTPISDGKTTRYLGVWDKETLYDRLTDYEGLILLSQGEAAPLVVPEALAAGLRVLTSLEASANLPTEGYNNFIINGNSTYHETLEQIRLWSELEEPPVLRIARRQLAESHFSWEVIAKEYIELIKDFNEIHIHQRIS